MLASASMPNIHRLKMRAVRILITDALDNAQQAILVQVGQTAQSGMQSQMFVQLQGFTLRYRQRWPSFPILVVVERYDGIEAVVATGQLNHNQNRLSDAN